MCESQLCIAGLLAQGAMTWLPYLWSLSPALFVIALVAAPMLAWNTLRLVRYRLAGPAWKSSTAFQPVGDDGVQRWW